MNYFFRGKGRWWQLSILVLTAEEAAHESGHSLGNLVSWLWESLWVPKPVGPRMCDAACMQALSQTWAWDCPAQSPRAADWGCLQHCLIAGVCNGKLLEIVLAEVFPEKGSYRFVSAIEKWTGTSNTILTYEFLINNLFSLIPLLAVMNWLRETQLQNQVQIGPAPSRGQKGSMDPLGSGVSSQGAPWPWSRFPLAFKGILASPHHQACISSWQEVPIP